MLFESHDVNPTKVIADRIQKKIFEQMQAQLAEQIVENADKKKDKKPAAKKGKARNTSKKSTEHAQVLEHSDDEEPVKVDLAYKIGRYNDDESPTCIYLPTR